MFWNTKFIEEEEYLPFVIKIFSLPYSLKEYSYARAWLTIEIQRTTLLYYFFYIHIEQVFFYRNMQLIGHPQKEEVKKCFQK